jgi:GGDEF domain-containing protein
MSRRVELTDMPTGLTTRDGFDPLLKFAFSLGDRGLPPTLLLLAPDGDPSSWGATFLDDLGQALALVTRQTDVVARYTENEFVCLLVDCNTSGGIIAADRIRASMQDFTERTGVTLSAGIATYAEWMETGEVLMNEVRRALDVAQIAGGNRTEIQMSDEAPLSDSSPPASDEPSSPE